MSYVTDYPAADPETVAAHYLHKLSLETDCADVNAAIQSGEPDFVLLHVVGSDETFARRHLPGLFITPSAYHRIPHGRMARRHAVCGVLRRAALQRCRPGGSETGAARQTSEGDARRHHRLGR